ncbi:MAG: transporter substrate-binding domain-containing protein [Pseudomonadota bacterium]
MKLSDVARPTARALRLAACAVGAAALAGAPCLAGDIPVTIYADEGYPPYSFAQNGKPAGLYYEIVKAAVARIEGYRVEIKTVPWKRGMAMLEHGSAFALYPPYLNTRDEPWTWPYSLPLFEEHVVAVCRKDALSKKLPMAWPRDFYGLRIGNNAGFIVGGAEFDQAVKDGKIALSEARDNAANISKLMLNRLDCYINDRQAIAWTIKAQKHDVQASAQGGQPELVEAAVIGVEQGFLGYSDRDHGKYPFKTDFAKKFDTVIYQMKRQGEIERIAQAYFRAN